jgi:hypothetical protein
VQCSSHGNLQFLLQRRVSCIVVALIAALRIELPGSGLNQLVLAAVLDACRFHAASNFLLIGG